MAGRFNLYLRAQFVCTKLFIWVIRTHCRLPGKWIREIYTFHSSLDYCKSLLFVTVWGAHTVTFVVSLCNIWRYTQKYRKLKKIHAQNATYQQTP